MPGGGFDFFNPVNSGIAGVRQDDMNMMGAYPALRPEDLLGMLVRLQRQTDEMSNQPPAQIPSLSSYMPQPATGFGGVMQNVARALRYAGPASNPYPALAQHGFNEIAQNDAATQEQNLRSAMAQQNAAVQAAREQRGDRMENLKARQDAIRDMIALMGQQQQGNIEQQRLAQGEWHPTPDGQHMVNTRSGEVRAIGENVGKTTPGKVLSDAGIPYGYQDATGTYYTGDAKMPAAGQAGISAMTGAKKAADRDRERVAADASVRSMSNFETRQKYEQGMKDSEEGRKAATELKAVQDFEKSARAGNVWASQNLLYQHVRANVQGAGRMTQAELQYAMKAGSFGDRMQRWWSQASQGRLTDKDITDIVANIRSGYGEKVRSARESWQTNMPANEKLPPWLQQDVMGPSGGASAAQPAGGGKVIRYQMQNGRLVPQ